MDVDNDPRDYMTFAEEQALEREDRAKRFIEQQHSGALTDADRDEGYSDPYYYDEQYDDDEFDWDDETEYEFDENESDPLPLTFRERIELLMWWRRRQFYWWRIRQRLYRCSWCGRIKRFGDHSKCVPF